MMRVIVDAGDYHAEAQASGGYNPEVMRDLTNRATEALVAAIAVQQAAAKDSEGS